MHCLCSSCPNTLAQSWAARAPMADSDEAEWSGSNGEHIESPDEAEFGGSNGEYIEYPDEPAPSMEDLLVTFDDVADAGHSEAPPAPVLAKAKATPKAKKQAKHKAKAKAKAPAKGKARARPSVIVASSTKHILIFSKVFNIHKTYIHIF